MGFRSSTQMGVTQMDTNNETSTVYQISNSSAVLRQTVANLRYALVVEMLAECLAEVEYALADCLGIPEQPELHLPIRAAVPHLPLRARVAAAIEQDRQVATARAIEARRRMPPQKIDDPPVIRPAWEGEDTLKVNR